MNNNKLINLKKCKELYDKGENISIYLRNKYNLKHNSKQSIEISYELQAGSYIDEYKKYKILYDKYSQEIASHLNKTMHDSCTILDVGCGEITVLTNILNYIKFKNIKLYAFDISLSRIVLGTNFFNKNIKSNIKNNFFVGEMTKIPLPTKSIDYVISSHALEPNGGDEKKIVKELLRICKKKLILFEPCYEKTKEIGIKKRIKKLGYIKNLEKVFEKQGGIIESVFPLQNPIDKNNPTYCYMVEPSKQKDFKTKKITFTDPGTDYKLYKRKNYYQSEMSGLIYPLIDNIPLLNMNNSIIYLKNS